MAEQREAQLLIHELRAAGWTDQAIGRAVGRNSSLIYQGGTGAKPLNNLLSSLREMVASGVQGPKVARSLPFVPTPPESRLRASGQPARVREGRDRHEQAVAAGRASGQARRIPAEDRASVRELPNGQRVIAGDTVASVRLAADVADAMSGNARVNIVVKTADGHWQKIGKHGGIRPDTLKEYFAGMRRGGGAGAGLAALAADMNYDELDLGDDPEFELYVTELGEA